MRLSIQRFFLIFTLIALVTPVFAESVPDFMRLSRNDKKIPTSLDAAIISYTKGDVVVDLVSAVHVGEGSYYDQLNSEFEGYDAVLYELIAPEGTKVERKEGDDSKSILSSFQHGLKDLLGLEFQLDRVNYNKKNFVHADMTPDAFSASMKKRGESIWSMLFTMFMKSQEIQNKYPQQSPEFILMQMVLFPNSKFTFKRFLAEQFQDVGVLTELLEGPNGSTILSERNKVALGVMQKEISKGKKHLAIFYGAGHMPDMHKRLTTELGFSKSTERWIKAWQLE